MLFLLVVPCLLFLLGVLAWCWICFCLSRASGHFVSLRSAVRSKFLASASFFVVVFQIPISFFAREGPCRSGSASCCVCPRCPPQLGTSPCVSKGPLCVWVVVSLDCPANHVPMSLPGVPSLRCLGEAAGHSSWCCFGLAAAN
jgi:hypothetical protein